MICYYFYKNVVLVFTELHFAYYNGYSGQNFFADWLPMLYNAVWSSWLPLFAYIFEQDVDDRRSILFPVLYRAGQKRVYFNFGVFWKWVFLSILHGIILFYVPMWGLEESLTSHGRTYGHWMHTTLSFTAIIHLVTIKLFLETNYWNAINV